MRYKEGSIYKRTFIHVIILSVIIIFHCMAKQVCPCHPSLIFSATTAYGDDTPALNELDLDAVKGLEDEVALLAEELFVTIASRMEEKAVRAPSMVTVITAKEIKNIGARTLFDILQTVPGFDTIKNASFGVNRFGARGMQASDTKIKVLIDGHSLNMPFNGRATTFFDDLPLKNVKKIEIIRGPGSALYGENAFLAVVNIITKDADDIDGIEVATGFGRYDTNEYGILFGKTLYNINISGYARYHKTNGMSSTIDQDKIFGAPFALTPGKVNDSRINSDLNLKVSYKDIEFNAKYMNKNTEPFVGAQFALTDDSSEQRYNYVMGDLRYKLGIGDKITFKPRVYYDQYDFSFFEELFPDGFTIPFDLDGDGDIEVFPFGMLADGLGRNKRLGSEMQLNYNLFDNNTLTLGFDYIWEKQDNLRFITNFNPLTNASLGSMRDVSDTSNWIRGKIRQIWAVYIQDKWDITDRLGLTIGIRHDQYSDFEGTTNPRIGLVWNFMDNAHLKLLYGEAFRAPSFEETGTLNPALVGNPGLDPETIRTYEIGLGYEFNEFINANVNYFYNDINDEIALTQKGLPTAPQVYENTGGPHIQGIEFELKADLNKIWKEAYAFANYTYLDAEAEGDLLPGVPKHKGNVGVNFPIGKNINANLHTFISDKRPRAEADSRDDSPGYALVNLTLIAREFFKDMEIKASLFNLLDKDYSDPAPINTIPTDLPKPGRTFFFELSFRH